MRTKQTYNQKRKVLLSHTFPPRIVSDLINLEISITIPDDFELGCLVYLYGDMETGKTLYFAKLIELEIQDRWIAGTYVSDQFWFVNTTEFLSQLKRTFEQPGGSLEFNKLLQKAKNVEILCLDDLGTGKPGSWMLDIFYEILNHRYEYQLTTLISSNFDLGELETYLGDGRIPSRIRRGGQVLHKKHWNE